uniref:ATP synthase subunit delta, chloroplastic n=1 Tax=Bostrychia simpliciuscula TaxID=324754 RepID=A0A1Z1M853_9FLOR|nr:ATP synthase CF1 subunit delta [Bostrychia simpliciuscula]ARW62073.1 ATP synthase CF1 subunit delta [Bostrychia simpliciuscula]
MSNQNIASKIATPYAEALLEIAKNADLLQETSKNLSSISMILSESKNLEVLLSNPLVNILIKKNVLQELFSNQVNDFIVNFLLVLVDKRRITLLNAIIQKYLELSYKLESITIAELFSAVELTETQQNKIIDKIKKITKSNNVKLITTIDSNLIAGFIIRIGSKVIDASLAGKLKKMSFYLNTN